MREACFSNHVLKRPLIAIGVMLLWLLSPDVILAAAGVSSISTNHSGDLILANRFGDLDDDGRLSVLDLVQITRHIAGAQALSSSAAARADVDRDGSIAERDRMILVDFILGLGIATDEDWDSDGIPNSEEMLLGINPFLADTDRDGTTDRMEVAEETDPADPNSRPQMIVMASPAIGVVSWTPDSQSTVIFAAPSATVYFPSEAHDRAITLAQPPIVAGLSSLDRDAPVIMASPPVQTVFPAPGTDEPLHLAQPPVEVRAGVP